MGNYRGALELGAQIIEATDYNAVLEEHFREPHQTQSHTLVIPEEDTVKKLCQGSALGPRNHRLGKSRGPTCCRHSFRNWNHSPIFT